jgi:hypothetical protein
MDTKILGINYYVKRVKTKQTKNKSLKIITANKGYTVIRI